MKDIEKTEEEFEDDGLGDLLEGYVEAKKEEAERQDQEEDQDDAPQEGQTEEGERADTEGESAEEPEEGAGESDEEPDDGEERVERKPVTFKYRGKEYTLEELEADEELRTKVFTGANQQSHYQQLYEQQKLAFEQLQLQIQQQQAQFQQYQEQLQQQMQPQQGQPQQAIPPEVIERSYKENIKQMVDQGYLEEDLLEYYPRTAAGIMFMRDNFGSRIMELEAQINQLLSSGARVQHQNTRANYVHQIDSQFDAVANQGGIYEPLSNPDTRTEFVQYLTSTVDPPVQALMGENGKKTIEKLWVAYNHQAILDEMERKKAAAETEAKKRLQFATGDGVGSKPGSSKSSQKSIPGEEEGWADL